MVKIFLCRLQGIITVSLPRIYSRSKKTVLYLETRIRRELKRGATEIVQIFIRHVQCTIHIPYTMISKAVFITERRPNPGKVTFRTFCIKDMTLDPRLYAEPIPTQRILSIIQ